MSFIQSFLEDAKPDSLRNVVDAHSITGRMLARRTLNVDALDSITANAGRLVTGSQQLFITANQVTEHYLNTRNDYATGRALTPIIRWGYGFFKWNTVIDIMLTGHSINHTGGDRTIAPKAYVYNGSGDSTYNLAYYGKTGTIAGGNNEICGWSYHYRLWNSPCGGANIAFFEDFNEHWGANQYGFTRQLDTIALNQTGTESLNDLTGVQLEMLNGLTSTALLETTLDLLTVTMYEITPSSSGVYFLSKPGTVTNYEYPACDTYIYANAPTTNYGTSANMYVGEYNGGAGDIQRGLIKFVNVDNIPSNANITSATLRLVISADYSSNARTMDVFRVLRDWTETGATWNKYDGTNDWGTAGCGNSTNDYDGSVVWGSYAFTASEAVGKLVEISLDVTEFKKWVDGTNENYGFLLKMQTETDDEYGFQTSASTEPMYYPSLEVVYSLP